MQTFRSDDEYFRHFYLLSLLGFGIRVSGAHLHLPAGIHRIAGVLQCVHDVAGQCTEPRELYEYGPKLAKAMEDIPGVRDVTTDIQLKNPELRVNVDRDRAASLGISVQQIEDALYSAYGNRQVSTIFAPDNTYAVILELDPAAQHRPEALQKLYIRSSQGRLVPIGKDGDEPIGIADATDEFSI